MDERVLEDAPEPLVYVTAPDDDITGDTDEEDIPSSLLQTDDSDNDSLDTIELPERYMDILNRNRNEETQRCPGILEDSDREKDMALAMRWIKQEVMLLKKQDRQLFKQFRDVRDRILQLRNMTEFPSTSDLSSMAGSMYSLEGDGKGFGFGPLGTIFPEYRGRTTSMSSLARKREVGSPILSRIRWKSNEIL